MGQKLIAIAFLVLLAIPSFAQEFPEIIKLNGDFNFGIAKYKISDGIYKRTFVDRNRVIYRGYHLREGGNNPFVQEAHIEFEWKREKWKVRLQTSQFRTSGREYFVAFEFEYDQLPELGQPLTGKSLLYDYSGGRWWLSSEGEASFIMDER